MRDYFVLGTVLLSLPVCFARPFFGVLMWTWVGIMNPHRLSWGVALEFPVALCVGAATLLGFLLSAEPKRLPRSPGTRLLLALWVCLTISTIFAYHFDLSYPLWIRRSKMFLIVVVMLMLLRTRERIRIMCFVIAACIGFYGVKGGLFAIATGLQYRVEGPDGTLLGGNNAIAVGLNMTLPMLLFLQRDVKDWWLRLFLWGAFALTILATVSTYSRGGFVGLCAVLVLLLLKSRRRLIGAVLFTVAVAGAYSFVPDRWFNRMETIETYEQDSSAMGRVNAWILAWRLAVARPLFGWGPDAMEDKTLYDVYYPESETRNDVHGAYFQLLGEGGFITFGVFISLFGWCLFSMQRLVWRCRGDPEWGWMATHAEMVQVSLVGYLVSAMFLELAFLDVPYQLAAVGIALGDLAQDAAERDRLRNPATMVTTARRAA